MPQQRKKLPINLRGMCFPESFRRLKFQTPFFLSLRPKNGKYPLTYTRKNRIIVVYAEKTGTVKEDFSLSGVKKTLMVLLILVLVASIAAGVIWHLYHYVMVDFIFYPRQAQSLDLRGQDISISHYDKLSGQLPECNILWDVPFQNGTYPQDIQEITVDTLSDEDVLRLDYLTELKTVQAEKCADYAQLIELQKRRPELELVYKVKLAGKRLDRDVEKITLKNILPEEIPLLQCFLQLKTVVCSGGDVEAVTLLRDYCGENGMAFFLKAGNQEIPADAKTLTVSNITQEELSLLRALPELQTLHLSQPKAEAQSLIQFRADFPERQVSWERTVCGISCSTSDTEIDLSEGRVTRMSQLEEGLAYFPDVKQVFLGQCGIDNEELAAYREKMREQFKVVWVVTCGEKLTARTDATSFMPIREHVYYFQDDEAYNLRYCEEMVCLDIGHMSIHQIDFVEFMPNLEYLILAHTQVQYIEPIRHCKNLKFLELDWSPVRDVSPLVDCTALEDLNLGNTYASLDPIAEMTWLKNLWIIGRGAGASYQMREALPNTTILSAGDATVAGGWRNLPNYYKMRDCLGMEYMSW